MGKGKKPVKDIRGYAFATTSLVKKDAPKEVPDKSKDKQETVTTETSPTPSEPSTTRPTTEITTANATSITSTSPIASPSSVSPPTALPTLLESPTQKTTPELDLPAWDDEPEAAIEEDVIDIEFVRTSRVLRNARPLEDDSSAKAEIDKLPYLALEDKTEHDVLAVLHSMGALDFVDTNEKVFAQRTLKKLNTVYTVAAEDIGFREADVEQAMRVTGGFPLSVVLDWLCINVANEHMPQGIADKMYFTNASSSIELSKATRAEGSKPDVAPAVKSPSEDKKEKEREREQKEQEAQKAKGNMKSWIMQYAQEEEEEDDLDLDNYGRKSEKKESLQEKIERGKAEKAKQREKAKQEQEAAQSSKQEQEAAPRTVASTEASDADLEAGMDALGMFDENAAAVAPTVTVVEAPVMHLIDVAVPKSWTGKTPKTSFTEWYRNKLRRTNAKVKGTGFKYNLTKKGNIVRCDLSNKGTGVKEEDEFEISMPENEYCATIEEAENYISTITLYKFAASIGLHRLLPPVFRELWNKWDNEIKEQYNLVQRKKDEHRVLFLKEVMQVSPSKVNFSPHLAVPGSLSPLREPEYSSSNVNGSSKATSESEQLRQQFEKRKTSREFEKYIDKRKALPIFAKRDEILRNLDEHRVVIISGETGSGKSTQVPQFIVEDWLGSGKGDKCNVVCTEPRRISAISLATRVSLEMGDGEKKIGSNGSLCGYQIRLESKVSKTTRVTYCTTGIALRRLEDSPTLDGVSHVVVDEVHERTLESDFLLIILKKLLAANPNLRVILMSATINAEEFSAYFYSCPIINVSGRTFPVHPYFLEDAIELTSYIMEEDSEFAIRKQREKNISKINVSAQRGNTHTVSFDMNEAFTDDLIDDYVALTGIDSSALSHSTLLTLSRYDEAKVNYELIELLLRRLCLEQPPSSAPPSESEDDLDPLLLGGQGAILIFLPGILEIRSLYDHLVAQREFGDANKFWVLPLHSSLTTEQQVRVFDVPEQGSGIRKIVLSTNIAETGITIPDCTVVIDCGRVKEMSYDERKAMSILKDSFISKANALQRRGRAGRVQRDMAANQLPEILRLPLEELCLKIKVYGFGKIADFLSSALSPPAAVSVTNAIENLIKVQALDRDERLTPLGSHLSSLPVDVHVGKMILFGAIFRCLDPILTIAACISFKSPFVRPFGKEDEADKARAIFKTANSDLLSLYSVYLSWREKIAKGKNSNSAKDFCRKFYCSFTNFTMIEDMKRQLIELLVSIGFVEYDSYIGEKQKLQHSSVQLCPMIPAYNISSSSLPILNSVLTAGLYPKVLLNTSHPAFTSLPIASPPRTLTNLGAKTVVFVHPASINHNEEMRAHWFVYHTIVKSTKVFVWDCNAVSAYPIFLFSGDIDVTHASKLVVIDKSIKFKCYAKTAVIFKRLRDELNVILKTRISDPGLHKEASSQQQTKIISTITALLESEYEKEKRIFVPVIK